MSVDQQTRDMGTPSVERMLATAVEALCAAAEDRVLNDRLARADTTCALHLTDVELGLTALLDRSPIDVAPRVLDDAESRIYGTAAQWMPVFASGTLGIALVRGELQWEGPVRKFLRVFPIFRTVYADVARGRRRAGRLAELDR